MQANCAASDFVREGYGTTDPHQSPLWIKTLGLLREEQTPGPWLFRAPENRLFPAPVQVVAAALEKND
ncbi:MAG: hypothetical protein GY792_27125 [Gammaproteobacteria bacterium]|nr:hypothetical protein [Gammaproteobacteria bacterium]